MRSPELFTRSGLYAITDGPRPDLHEACAAALRGGAVLLQYRDKSDDQSRRHAEATDLVALCARHRVPLIINDDVELAAAVGAAGVHLGADDAALDAARERLGAGAIIGGSCYDSLQRARELSAAGATYLAFGAFFASPTKPLARRAVPDLLTAAKAFGRPLVAIGGMTPDNASPVIAAGANFIAAVSGVFAAPDIEAASRRYTQLFHK